MWATLAVRFGHLLKAQVRVPLLCYVAGRSGRWPVFGRQSGLLSDRDQQTVKDWTETSRYTRKTKNEAARLYNAIADKNHGVFAWIKSHW